MAGLPLETLPDVLRRSPFHRLLGLEMVRASAGEVVIRMPFREELLAGDDEVGQYVHGGTDLAELAEWVLGVLDPQGDVLLTTPAGQVVAVVQGDTGAVVRVRP